MSDLTNQLAIAEKEEVGRGIRYLLAEPLLTARSAPDRFDVVRRRRVPIAAWFDTFCGWDTRGCVRSVQVSIPRVRLGAIVLSGRRSTAAGMCCCVSSRRSFAQFR